MNKLLVGAAVTMTLSVSSTAWAQQGANVQIYGLLYSGLRHVDNTAGDSVTGLTTGPSRWGLKGSDDLGGGTSALFTLESGLDLSTGKSFQGGRMFGRQAFVGLADKDMGTLTLGRQYDMVASWLAPYTPAGKWNGYMSHPGDNDNLNWQFRINNAVKYVSPVVEGFQVGALYGFGEAQGSSTEKSTTSLGLNYKTGGLSLSAAYLQVHNPAASVSEGNWVSVLFPAVSKTSAQNAYAITPDKMTVTGLGADYSDGPWQYTASYTRSTYSKIGNGVADLPNTDVSFQNIDANVSYMFSSKVQGGAGYAFTKGKVDVNGFSPKYHQLNLVANYFLSKRTILQAGLTYQKAAGDAENAYILFGSDNASSTSKQRMLMAGVYHLF